MCCLLLGDEFLFVVGGKRRAGTYYGKENGV
jgi:hypothetical protein